MDVNRLGALVCKTVSRGHRDGNPPPRVAEVEGGMINSIGLPTKGHRLFPRLIRCRLQGFTPPLVARITRRRSTISRHGARRRTSDVDVIEVNISCRPRPARQFRAARGPHLQR
jgi:dihydroorotate dehydrogenase (NAD+) catalytic subunit